MSSRKIKLRNSAQFKAQQDFMAQQREQALTMERMKNNPLPEGEEGLGILRTLHQCPVPQRSQELQTLLQEVLKSDEPELEPFVDKILHDSTVAFLKVQKVCKTHRHVRRVCTFESDEEDE